MILLFESNLRLEGLKLSSIYQYNLKYIKILIQIVNDYNK